jgi:hypothetical protein
VSFLWLIRLFTLLIAVSYSVAYAPADWLAMHFNRGLAIISETGHSWLLTAGDVGVFATAALSIPLAFFAVPRWRMGARLLSFCMLLMGLSLLARLEDTFVWQQYLSIFIQLGSGARTICFALPPLILAAMLQHPVVQKELGPAHAATQNV